MTEGAPSILHLIPADGIGGVEIAAKSMQRRKDLPCGFELTFIEPDAPRSRSFSSALDILASNWRTLLKARSLKPDVIICSLWRSVPCALALKALHPRAKLVYFIHCDATTHKLDALFSKVAINRADQVWGDSASALEGRGIDKRRSRVISFVTERAPSTDKQFQGARFVSWGRLNYQKGFDRAIRLVGDLVKQGLDCHYDLYGPEGGEREKLTQLVSDLGIAKNVTIHGPVSRGEIAEISGKSSFFLQLSRSEGMCMAVVEAMQHGLVPIVSPVGEMARYVVPGNGLIVDPDKLTDAASLVRKLISDPKRWKACSQASMQHWRDAPIYAEDVCRAATDLVGATIER